MQPWFSFSLKPQNLGLATRSEISRLRMRHVLIKILKGKTRDTSVFQGTLQATPFPALLSQYTCTIQQESKPAESIQYSMWYGMNVNKRKNGCVIPVHVKNQNTFNKLEQNTKLDLWKWGVENMGEHLNESLNSNKNQICNSGISHFF